MLQEPVRSLRRPHAPSGDRRYCARSLGRPAYGGTSGKWQRVVQEELSNLSFDREGRAGTPGATLYGVIGRKAGTVEGFRFSDGLKAAGWVWTPEKIDEWITFPKKMIRDTFMNYRQSDPDVRKAIITYIATQKD